jgi:hydroxymethylpyrimidine pyrophosphatase-like HAD family hydrolase
MKYKAIMLDLDDTTVLHGKESLPTARVTDAIARAKEKMYVCIVTARTLKDTMLIIKHLSLSGLCVLTNGTQIFDPVRKKIVHEVPLPREVIPAIRKLCASYHVKTLVYNGEKDTEGPPTAHQKVLSIYVPEIEPDRADGLVDVLESIHGINVQKLAAWDKRYLSVDITSRYASKLYGILEVSRILHIKTEEIIGVGDGYNDFPLLMACGLKIAMANAVPELKAIADFIAPSVYEDGVATVIEKFVLSG